MVEVKLLEFGYSLEHEKHFVRLNIKGMDEEKKKEILPVIGNIPLGDIKRFVVESDDDNGLKILEYFPKKEYPFNKDIPEEKEIKGIEKMVKKFMGG